MGRVQIGGIWVEEWPKKGKRKIFVNRFCIKCGEVPEEGFPRNHVKRKIWICAKCFRAYVKEKEMAEKELERKQMEEFEKWMKG